MYAARGQETISLLSATSNGAVIPEALAFVDFFVNNYERVVVRPAATGRLSSTG